MISLNYELVEDGLVRDALETIEEYINGLDIIKGQWAFFEIRFDRAVTNFKFPHNLGYRPRDVIQTSKTGAGSITFNFDRFDALNLDITTTDACVVRVFVGTYSN